MKEHHNLTLDKEEVEKAIKKIKPFGGKLSPLINNFLRKFNLGEIKL